MGVKIPDTNGGGGSFAPTALLKETGASIKGKLTARRMVDTSYGAQPVYAMIVEDASCKFTQDKKEVEPAAGATIEFFAPTRLERQLAQVGIGKTVTIAYVGQKKVGRGNPAHIFDVTMEA